MPYEAVVFDLDGTLLDTLRDIADSANAVLGRAGFPVHPISAYRYFVGEGMRTLAFKVLPEPARDPASVDKFVQLIDREYARRWMLHTCVYDGLPELFDALTARHVKMAVFSNKPQKYTAASVGKFLGKWPFAAVLGASESTPHKPDPSGAHVIAGRLGIPPQQFIYLGDTAIDMKTALAAGMFPVGALWGFRTADELIEAGAKDTISRPGQLLRYFRRNIVS